MSGPVRKPDEILPADAASGAGRTPADRPAVCLLPSEITSPVVELWDALYHLLKARHGSSEKEAVEETVQAHVNGRVKLNRWEPLVRSLCQSGGYETGKEHIRNALEMLTNCGDDKFLIGNERRVVYDAGDIDAVKARLLKALGL